MLKDGRDAQPDSKRKLSVAFTIYRFGQNIGGAERVAFELAKRISKLGHEVHIFSHSFHNISKLHAVFHTVPIQRTPYFYRRFSFAKKLNEMLADYTFDIVQSFSRSLKCDVYRFGSGIHGNYLKNTKTNFLNYIISKINPKHIYENKLERLSMKDTAYKTIISMSNIEKEALVQTYGINPDRIKIIYNGVNTTLFTPDNKKLYRDSIRKEFKIGTDFVILFCGNGFERKGLQEAIKVCGQLRKRKIRFTLLVVGKGDYKAYKTLARRHGISDAIIMLGSRPHMEQFYGASDIFLLPTHFDPFPNSCLEAMSTGIPVITTKNTGISEIVENNIDSFIVQSPSNIAEMADIITTLSQNGDQLTNVSNNARNKALKYDWDEVVKSYLDVYTQISNK